MQRLSESPAWRALMRHRDRMSTVHLRDLFASDPTRASQYARELDGLLFDFSKQRIQADTLRLLLALAKQQDFAGWRARLFAGEAINHTEQRAVGHMALRMPRDDRFEIDGQNVVPEVWAVLDRMRAFVDAIHSGQWVGYSGKPITDVVNLGIGGSDLGPYMASRALRPFWQESVRTHFVSNLDAAHLHSHLAHLNPEQTLFIVASKSFRTLETLTNAHSAREWLVEHAGNETAVAQHFVAVSSAPEQVAEFGIDLANLFPMWDWVGGRYSVWSAVGLPVALAVGMDAFEEMLSGAHAMDRHFRKANDLENVPLLHGLLAVWNRNFLGAATRAVLPYDHLLLHLPSYLQQLDMESLGKSVNRLGDAVCHATGAVVWGEQGSNGQHAFFQFLHQGHTQVPVEFIASVQSHYPSATHQERLLANLIAQAEALMHGRTPMEVKQELDAQDLTAEERAILLPYRVFPGNVPSSVLLLDRMTPFALGRLLALYEHSVFVQSVIWNLNAFDQWGVELGKQLAETILEEWAGDALQEETHDASTLRLLRWAREHR
jgi:glucose-6-phosphate isomerase